MTLTRQERSRLRWFCTGDAALYSQWLRLAVDEIIHHDDVSRSIIIRPGGLRAGSDSDTRDKRVLKHYTEKGKAPVARRSRDETAEDQFAVFVEVLHPCAGPTRTPAPLFRPKPIRLVYVCEYGTETTDRCRENSIETGHKEQRFGDVAAYRSEKAQRAKRAEDGRRRSDC